MKYLTIILSLSCFFAVCRAQEPDFLNQRGDGVWQDPFIDNLGVTAVGKSLFRLANPGAVRYLRINADNTITLLDGAGFVASVIPNGSISNVMLANGAVANLSGTNTGDNAVNSNYSGLSATITAGLATKSPLAGSSSITTTGTITAGVWDATSITDSKIASSGVWNAKQDALVSGVSIKTINGVSVLGAGNMVIAGGGSSFSSADITGQTAIGSIADADTIVIYDASGSVLAKGTFTQLLTWLNTKALEPSSLTASTATVTTLNLGGSDVTATGAELNALDGFLGSVTTLNHATSGLTGNTQTQLDGKLTSSAIDTSTELANILTDESGSSGGFIRSTGSTLNNTTFTGTIALPATAVTPGSYTNSNVTVGSDGRITAISNGSAGSSGDTRTGTHASPSTDNPLAPTWTSPGHTVWYGVAGEIDLPAAAGYADKTIIIHSTGSFIITVDPNGSEIIVRDGVTQSAGVSMTLSSGSGNFVSFMSDGSRWITFGYKGTLAAGS